MTREDIDRMWGQATCDSVEAGEMFSRYRFAEMVIEACAEVADSLRRHGPVKSGIVYADDVGAAIRAIQHDTKE